MSELIYNDRLALPDLDKASFTADPDNKVARRVLISNESNKPSYSVNPSNFFKYNETTSVTSSSTSTILSHVISGEFFLNNIQVSGDNLGLYEITLDGQPLAKKRTTYTEYNTTFDFTGLKLTGTIQVVVTNSSNKTSDYNATLEAFII